MKPKLMQLQDRVERAEAALTRAVEVRRAAVLRHDSKIADADAALRRAKEALDTFCGYDK